ncbi:hypothetical protein [Rhodohalobacter sp.]|uniref:hypothetical protein n=1 Tax=Rhodohalobacter sp. TaxID=1974210 RepID=UPI002ACD3DFC|nr:hypothetical protein [Rhodohalobacter sp.]MDZ7756155.1 hypothetical protein [Rhodohalobacter sp.]
MLEFAKDKIALNIEIKPKQLLICKPGVGLKKRRLSWLIKYDMEESCFILKFSIIEPFHTLEALDVNISTALLYEKNQSEQQLYHQSLSRIIMLMHLIAATDSFQKQWAKKS